MLLHYFGKLKTQIFCRRSADMEENANKLHLCTDFNISMRVTVYAEWTHVYMCICVNRIYEILTIQRHSSFLFTASVCCLAACQLCNFFNSSSNTNYFLSKSCPRRWIPCWLSTNTAVTSAVTNFWCHKLIAKVNKWYGEFYLQSVWGKTRYYKHWKYQNLLMNNKGRGD